MFCVFAADGLGQTAAAGCELGLSALGAIVWYLRHCLMDEELLSMKVFTNYTPVDLSTQSSQQGSPVTAAVKQSTAFSGQQRLVSKNFNFFKSFLLLMCLYCIIF